MPSTSSVPIPSLISIPTELKSLIFTSLPSKSLLAVSSTCRTLRPVALPLAYAHVTLTWDDSLSRHATAPCIHQFLRTVIANPALAQEIKTLALSAKECMYFSDQGRFRVSIPGMGSGVPASESAFFHKAIRALDLHADASWDAGLDDPGGAFFVMLGLVLGHCVRLQELDLSIAFLAPHSWFEELVQQSVLASSDSPKKAWAQHLKTFRLRCDTGAEAFSPGFLQLGQTPLWAFYLPGLQELVLEHFEDPISAGEMYELEESESEDWRVDWWPLPAEPTCAHLTTLRLTRCSAEARTLDMLLQRTQALRILDLDRVQHPESDAFDLDLLRAGLLTVARTLERLTVRYEVFFDEEYCENVSDMVRITSGRLSPLTPFSRLTYLEISLHTLFGSEDSLINTFFPLAASLPPKLQELVVTDDLYGFTDWQQYFEDAHVMAMFRRYLVGEDGEGEWKMATPDLREFVYDLRKRGECTVRFWDREEKREELVGLCEGQGLEGEVLWSY